jgi:ribosomal protein L13E
LSSKPRKKPEKKPAPAKSQNEPPVRPTGKAPEAVVVARHGTGVVTRLGRGFSKGELSGAGFSPHSASEWGLRLDVRRRSVIRGNVDSLKAWGRHTGLAKTTEGRARKAEEEIEKVGRAVEREAIKVEKEVVKVEKEVKEEAVKAEKAVRRKRAKPKAKPKKKAQA